MGDVRLFCDVFAEVHQNCGNLCTCSSALWCYRTVAHAVDETCADSPAHYIVGPFRNAVGIVELAQIANSAYIVAFVFSVTIKDGGHLFTGDVVVRTKDAIAIAADNVIGRCLVDSIGIPAAISNIGERAVCLRWLVFKVVKHGSHHRSG